MSGIFSLSKNDFMLHFSVTVSLLCVLKLETGISRTLSKLAFFGREYSLGIFLIHVYVFYFLDHLCLSMLKHYGAWDYVVFISDNLATFFISAFLVAFGKRHLSMLVTI
jgi:hypothetical protein